MGLNTTVVVLNDALPERFWEKVDKNGPVPVHRPELGPCWLWLGATNPKDYGSFSVGAKTLRAHRVAYVALVGAITAPQLDHLCRVHRCVNPGHLEPVTNQENLRRGRSAQREKTHCARGHGFTVENTRYVARSDGRRERACRACAGAAEARQRASKKRGMR